MHRDSYIMVGFCLVLAVLASSEAFFLKWGSDTSQSQQKWVQPQSVSPAYRYQYSYPQYDARKFYQIQNPQYMQPDLQNIQMQQNVAPIPISVPAGASLTPVSLQHVQLVPCMCPVAPEEAEKLQEQVGPGPYLAQTFSPQPYAQPQAYQAPQQHAIAAEPSKTNQ